MNMVGTVLSQAFNMGTMLSNIMPWLLVTFTVFLAYLVIIQKKGTKGLGAMKEVALKSTTTLMAVVPIALFGLLTLAPAATFNVFPEWVQPVVTILMQIVSVVLTGYVIVIPVAWVLSLFGVLKAD